MPWATKNHVPKPCARPNHLWLDLKSRLTLTIPPLNLNWSNHQLSSNFYRGISHTPPYHLGLSPNFTGELPEVCMPYQVLQPYAHLHAKCSITIFFSCVFMVTIPSPSVTSSSHFLYSLCFARPSMLCHFFSYAMPPHFYHAYLHAPFYRSINLKTLMVHFFIKCFEIFHGIKTFFLKRSLSKWCKFLFPLLTWLFSKKRNSIKVIFIKNHF